MDLTTSVSNRRLIPIFIILFTGFLFLFNIGKRDLWAPDEPRYAQVSKEMRDTGNYIVPHLNSTPYPDKPPLLFWLINVFSSPFGEITALSSRLPSAFAGIACCVALFYLGKGLYHNTRIALLASLILATSSKFLWMAHRVAFDVLLTTLVTMAIFCFYKAYTIHDPGATPKEREERGTKKQEGLYYILFYVLMALGVLTKGPVGFILPFLIILVYLTAQGNIGALKDAKPLIGGGIFVLIVFTWVYLASIYGGKEYTYQILFKQNVGRFASSFAHKRPFYYYFINFPVNFLPWSIFIPGIVIYLFSKKGRERTSNALSIKALRTRIFHRLSLQRSSSIQHRDTLCRPTGGEGFPLLPVIWFAVVFIFFSIVSGKRDIYVLPLYPAASLLTGWFLNEFIEQSHERYFRKAGYYPCYILSLLSLILCVLLPVAVYKFFPQYIAATIPFIIILLTGGIIMLRSLKYARIIPFLFTLIFVIFTTFTVSTLKAIPILDQFKSAKDICLKAKAVMKPDEKLGMYNFFSDPYLFYTERNHLEIIYGLENLKNFLDSRERVFLFVQEKDFKKVSKLIETPLFVIGKDSVGHRDVLFISNKDI